MQAIRPVSVQMEDFHHLARGSTLGTSLYFILRLERPHVNFLWPLNYGTDPFSDGEECLFCLLLQAAQKFDPHFIKK